jgi:hypothetical protein
MPKTNGSGVVFEYKFLNYQEQFTMRATNSVVVVELDWWDAADFLWDVLGWTDSNRGGLNFARTLPMRHPVITSLYCTDAKLVDYPSDDVKTQANQPDPFSDGFFTTGRILYALTFTRMPYKVLELEEVSTTPPEIGRYVTIVRRPQVRERQINAYQFMVKDTGVKLPTPAFVIDYEQDFVYTLHEIPESDIPDTAIAACGGHINETPFDDWPAKTLRFKGLAQDIGLYQGPNGQWYADLAYLFTYRPMTWDFFPDPAGGSPVEVVRVKDPTKHLYDTADFTGLFMPEPP